MSDEEFVRAHWERYWLYEGARKSELTIGVYPVKFFGATKEGVGPLWSAAAEFTREQLEQIRQLEAEISELDLSRQELIIWRKQIEEVGTPEFAGELAARSVRISRTVARLESALADLKRGMR